MARVCLQTSYFGFFLLFWTFFLQEFREFFLLNFLSILKFFRFFQEITFLLLYILYFNTLSFLIFFYIKLIIFSKNYQNPEFSFLCFIWQAGLYDNFSSLQPYADFTVVKIVILSRLSMSTLSLNGSFRSCDTQHWRLTTNTLTKYKMAFSWSLTLSAKYILHFNLNSRCLVSISSTLFFTLSLLYILYYFSFFLFSFPIHIQPIVSNSHFLYSVKILISFFIS